MEGFKPVLVLILAASTTDYKNYLVVER